MFDNRWVMAFSVRDGKIVKFEEYADTQALAAAHEHKFRRCGRGAGVALSTCLWTAEQTGSPV